MNSKEILLKELMAYDFAIIELNLYLDTHPYDKNTLDMFNKYVKMSTELREKYETLYGPLTSVRCQSKFPWQWVQGAWPWDANFMKERSFDNVDL
jgi:spore coat protein JB